MSEETKPAVVLELKTSKPTSSQIWVWLDQWTVCPTKCARGKPLEWLENQVVGNP